MTTLPMPDPTALAAQIWGWALKHGWIGDLMQLHLTWTAPDSTHAQLLRERLRTIEKYSPARAERYEPEDNPLDTIVCSDLRIYTAKQVAAEVLWAATFGEECGVVLAGAGLGITDQRAA